LKIALSEINTYFGGVKHIVHTAAVVNDATIAATNAAGFENVLRPKVIGSWNLHVASQELNLTLESFALFSSTK
jgi:thioester reductase-like protein